MKRIMLLMLIALLLAPATLKAEDWPAWRGPEATGSTPTGKTPTKWSAETADWKIELPGKGTSTPIVCQGRIYLTTPVTTPTESQDAVMALDASGKQVWMKTLGPASKPKHKTLASSCNASPVTDGKAIFVRFRSGRLAALELDGSVRWQINLDERFGPENLVWDQGSSPVVSDKFVIVTRMHHGDSWFAAFDKASGELRWQQKRNYETANEGDNAYTTPVFFDYKGRKAFMIWGGEHLTAHAIEDGAQLWTCGDFNPKRTPNWPTIALPVVAGRIAVVPVGRDDRTQGHVQGIRIDGSGDVTATGRAWMRDDFGVFCCSPALYQGRVYLLRDRGGIVCLDPASGKTIWEAALPRTSATLHYYASPLVVAGVLYAAREDGTVFAAKLGETGMEVLGENPMGERIVASPVPYENGIVIRGDKHVFGINAKGK